MSKRQGQQIPEIAIVGGVIFSVCALSVFVFGDQIASVFSSNKSISMFGSQRSNINTETSGSRLLAASKNSQSGATSITINNKEFKSPVDTVLLAKLSSNSVQTSGSSSNIEETIRVMKGYVIQLKEILKTLEDGPARQQALNAIAAYEKAIKDYEAMNNSTSTSTNRQIVNDLDITTNLEVSGANAVLFNEAISKLLYTGADSNGEMIPNPNLTSKQIETIELYKQSMLNLGASIEYTIDSRVIKDFDLEDMQNQMISKARDTYDLIDRIKDPDIKKLFNKISPILSSLNSFDDVTKLTKAMRFLDFTDASTPIKLTKDPTNPYSFSSNVSGTENISADKKTVAIGTSIGSLSISVKTVTETWTTGAWWWKKKHTKSYPAKSFKINGQECTLLAKIPDNLKAKIPVGNQGYTDAKYDAYQNGNDIFLVPKSIFNNVNADGSLNTNTTVTTENYKIVKYTYIPTKPRQSCHRSWFKKKCTTVYDDYMFTEDEFTKTPNEPTTTLGEIKKALQQILDLKTAALSSLKDQINADNYTDYSALINVYREGTYREILPESYSADAICKTLNPTYTSGGCAL